MHSSFLRLFLTIFFFAVSGSSTQAALPLESGYGPNPILPAPETPPKSEVSMPPVRGWPAGTRPRVAQGFQVQAYANRLDHPRWLFTLPNGDVLVAESSHPSRNSADRITLLRDADGDGTAEIRSAFLEGLHSPIGMAVIGENLFVANTDAVLRFPWQPGTLRITTAGQKIADLPAQPPNYHWTRNLLASNDGNYLYVSVGSNSNIAELGMQSENRRAAILQIDIARGTTRVYASGLRNPVGMDWQPQSNALWAVVNERDGLGNDLVPDYLTSVIDGGFYGWPWSYFGQHPDPRVRPQRPDLVATALVPDYGLGSHTAPLGLVFYRARLFPQYFMNGAFIAQHGSWNRKPASGYKVIFVPFKNGQPDGMPIDILTGFISQNFEAFGRPAGLAVDIRGALLVADDAGDTIWRISPVTATGVRP